MPYRATNTHRNLFNTDVVWEVKIYDSAGTVPFEFDIMGRDGVIFKHTGPTRDPEPGVYPSQVFINYVIPSTPAGLPNPQHQFVIDDIFTKNRSRFAIEVYRDSTLVFVGRFEPHNLRIENTVAPYAVQLVANDGLADLQNIDYSNNGTAYTGQDTMLEHIKKCIDRLNLQDFYGANDDFIEFCVNWFHKEMPDTDTNPFEYSRLDHRLFQGSRNKFQTCFQVLETIMKDWGCRMYYANGMYHVEQLTGRTDSNYSVWVYDKTFTETASSGTKSVERSISSTGSGGSGPLAGGVFGVLDNLREVEITLPLDTNNYLQEYLDKWSYNDQSVINLGRITIEDENDRLQFKTSIEYKVANLNDIDYDDGFSDIRIVWQAFIRVDALGSPQRYVTREISMLPQFEFDLIVSPSPGGFINPQLQQGPTWTPNSFFEPVEIVSDIIGLNATAVDIDDAPLLNKLDGGQAVVTIESPSFKAAGSSFLEQGDSVDLYFGIGIAKAVNAAGDDITLDTADWTIRWWVRSPELSVISENGQAQTIEKRFVKTNDVEAYRRLSLKATFGDLPNLLNGIQVFDGTDWVYSSPGWAIGELTGIAPFTLMLANEIMALRRYTKYMYYGSFATHQGRHDARYAFDSRFWLCMESEISTGSDYHGGTFLEIAEDDTTGMTDDEIDVTVGGPLVGLGPTGDSTGPNTPQATYPIVLEAKIRNDVSTVSVNLVNNAALEYEAGSVMVVTNLFTGKMEFFQITEDVDGTDPQGVDIVTKTFTNTFQPGDPVKYADLNELRKGNELFTVTAADIANGYLTVTKGVIIDPQYHVLDEDYEYLQVYRFGGQTRCYYSSEDPGDMKETDFGIDKPNNRIVFPTDYPLIKNENVKVTIWYARIA